MTLPNLFKSKGQPHVPMRSLNEISSLGGEANDARDKCVKHASKCIGMTPTLGNVTAQ